MYTVQLHVQLLLLQASQTNSLWRLAERKSHIRILPSITIGDSVSNFPIFRVSGHFRYSRSTRDVFGPHLSIRVFPNMAFIRIVFFFSLFFFFPFFSISSFYPTSHFPTPPKEEIIFIRKFGQFSACFLRICTILEISIYYGGVMFFLLMGTQLEDYHGQFSITSISGVPPPIWIYGARGMATRWKLQ